MWFKNALVYRLHNWDVSPETLEDSLAGLSLQSLSGLELQNRGWVPSQSDPARYVYELNGQLLLSYASEKKLLPASVVNQVLKQRVLEMEERDGFKPGRKRTKELKEEVTDELLPRAFAVRSKTLIWVNPKHKLLVIDSSSLTKADDVVALLVRTIPGLSLSLVRTKLSPTVAMTSWLTKDDAPAAFTIDRDCELKGRTEEASTVRYVKHALDAQEIKAHIEAGKEATKLAMTWSDKISFVLTEAMQIKRLAPLDILKENSQPDGQDDAFDADFALMTTELSALFEALFEALGGQLHAGDDAMAA
ncbi:MAG: recombination-associated protein RdgC [Limnobacter sp.]|nr:recombination-associated protein RdgC [Limnobacter sp.]